MAAIRQLVTLVVWAMRNVTAIRQATFSVSLAAALTGCALTGTMDSIKSERSDVIKTGNDEFVHYVLTPVNGPPVEYYISQPRAPAPLVIYLQGSGCTPVFPPSGFGKDHASTVFSSTTMARTYPVTVMVINKPYVPVRAPRDGGIATNCPKEFNDYFSLESWVSHIETAYAHALKQPWVDSRKTLVIGVSEGATVAAVLAAREPRITDVALVGGSGPTQLYDFIAGAYASSPDQINVLAALGDLELKRTAIASAPQDSTRFAWGHSYKRWSSFFASSSVENLTKSAANIYVVSGMADTAVPILSTEVLYAELIRKGRNITMRRIPGGNHALTREDASINEVEGEYDRIVRWYLHIQ